MGREGLARIIRLPLGLWRHPSAWHGAGCGRSGGVEYLRLFGAYPTHSGLLGRVVDEGIWATFKYMLQQRPGLVFVMLGAFLVMVYLLVVRGGVMVKPRSRRATQMDGVGWLSVVRLRGTAKFESLQTPDHAAVVRSRRCRTRGTKGRNMTVATWIVLLLLSGPLATFAQQWRQIETGGPSARRNAAAIYDRIADRIVLFGGRGSSGDLADVWTFDVATESWQSLPVEGAGPTARFSHNAVHDAHGGQLLIWSGRMLDASGSTLLNDVWAFDLITNSWTNLATTTTVPVARYGTAAVFDPDTGTLVTFAGFTTLGRFDDTWRFDPLQRLWQDVTATSPQPGERCLHAAAYDSQRRRMIMFGGQRGNAALDDAWALDLSTDLWTALPPAPETGGRKFPAVAYDPKGDRFLVFGGERTDGTRGGDLWALDLQREVWSTLTTAGPPARDGAVLVYVPSRGGRMPQIILTGGTTAEGNADDTWSLQLEDPVTAVAASESTLPIPSLAAYPNPFNANVVLESQLATRGSLTIYDTIGHRVRNLGRLSPGPLRRLWDGRDDAGRIVASGVYLAVLETPTSRHLRRLALLR